MVREFHLADFLTLANAACGLAAVFFSMLYMGSQSPAHFFAAAAMTPAALLFDWLDGGPRPHVAWAQPPLLSHTLRSATGEGAMQRAVDVLDEARGIVGITGDLPCDERGVPGAQARGQ